MVFVDFDETVDCVAQCCCTVCCRIDSYIHMGTFVVVGEIPGTFED